MITAALEGVCFGVVLNYVEPGGVTVRSGKLGHTDDPTRGPRVISVVMPDRPETTSLAALSSEPRSLSLFESGIGFGTEFK